MKSWSSNLVNTFVTTKRSLKCKSYSFLQLCHCSVTLLSLLSSTVQVLQQCASEPGPLNAVHSTLPQDNTGVIAVQTTSGNHWNCTVVLPRFTRIRCTVVYSVTC